MPTESSPAARCDAYLACPTGAYPGRGAGSHGGAIPTAVPWAARSVPRWGVFRWGLPHPTSHIPHPTSHGPPSHGVAVNAPSLLTGPTCARPFRAHRRCISLVSPRHRRGETIPNKIRSPERASQTPPFCLRFPRRCHDPPHYGPLHTPEYQLTIYFYK